MDDHSASTVALFAIHPRHANNILSGKKTVEFRKIRPRAEITHIVLYATQPIGKVVGIACVRNIDTGCPKMMWQRYEKSGGINKSEFFQYYSDAKTSVVYLLENATELEEPMKLSLLTGKDLPPQSYEYVSNTVLRLFEP